MHGSNVLELFEKSNVPLEYVFKLYFLTDWYIKCLFLCLCIVSVSDSQDFSIISTRPAHPGL